MHYSTASFAAVLALASVATNTAVIRAQGRIITEFPYSQSFAFVPTGTSTTPSGPIGAAVFPTTDSDGGEFTVDAGTNSVMVNGSTTGLNNNLGAGGVLRIQTSGSTSPTIAQGFILHCSFASRDAASISIDWAKVANGTSTRTNELRISVSVDSGAFTDLATATFDNSSTAQSGTLSVAIPEDIRGSNSARFRISSVNVSGTGTHARVIVDNLAMTELSDEPLPVKLLSFSATIRDQRVALTWATASEVSNAGFEIQRAFAGDTSFVPIASYLTHDQLRGLGTSPSGRAYSFDDDLVGWFIDRDTVLTYRLVDIELDGTRHEHSAHAVQLTRDVAEVVGTSVARLRLERPLPIPADDYVVARWTQVFDEEVVVNIVNACGEQVATQTRGLRQAGTHEEAITVAELANGAYTLVVRSLSVMRTQPFVIAR